MSNDKQERIVCAAIKIRFMDAAKDPDWDVLCDYSYRKIESSKSYKRYHFLHGSTAKDERGFITNYGLFVTPKEAMKIAVKGGQIKELAELDLIIREFEEYEEESGIETNQLIAARESYGEFYHQFSCRELKPEDLY